MTKFKVGDKVRVIESPTLDDNDESEEFGQVYTVVGVIYEVEESGVTYFLNDPHRLIYEGDWLEKVESF